VIWDLTKLGQFDHINRMITLSVITLSGFHCTAIVGGTFLYSFKDGQFIFSNSNFLSMDIQMHELKLIVQPIPETNTQPNLFCLQIADS
jgi:hypothetical protein